MTKGRLDYIIELLYNACILNKEGINQIQKKEVEKIPSVHFVQKIFLEIIFTRNSIIWKNSGNQIHVVHGRHLVHCVYYFFLHITSLK